MEKCPKCNSPLTLIKYADLETYKYLGLPVLWKCKACNYKEGVYSSDELTSASDIDKERALAEKINGHR